MLGKQEVKYIQSLSEKKYRQELKLFIAEGTKIVSEFMQLIPSQIEKIYATEEWLQLNDTVPQEKLVEVSEKELDRISQLKTPNQVLAVVKQFENNEPVNYNFALYLDTIQDPGNLGTIIRTADWFDVKNIVCSKGCADVYSPKLVQATMASLARVNVFYDVEENWFHKQNLPVYAAALDGRSVYTFEKMSKGILIIGNESKGIRQEFVDLATEKITIPGKGDAESLNAAVATGIILSHLLN